MTGWFPMGEGVANMPRYREVCLAAVRSRPLNPASADDVNLLAVVMRGEHSIQGFRNADIRVQINPEPSDAAEQRRQSQWAGRLLHAH